MVLGVFKAEAESTIELVVVIVMSCIPVGGVVNPNAAVVDDRRGGVPGGDSVRSTTSIESDVAVMLLLLLVLLLPMLLSLLCTFELPLRQRR